MVDTLPSKVRIAETQSGVINPKMVILTNVRPDRINRTPANNGINV
jgi:hypothetical protein